MGATSRRILQNSKWVSLSTGSTTTANLNIRTKSGVNFLVDWGDGVITSHANNATASHTYSSAYTGSIRFRALTGGSRNIDGIFSNAGAWNFNISTIASQCPSMAYQVVFSGNSMTLTGNISSLPSGLTYRVVFSGNSMTLTGDISSLPTGLTNQVYFEGNSMNLTGNISLLPTGLTNRVIFSGSSMALTGDIKTAAPNVTYLYISSTAAINTYTSGRVWKNMTTLYIRNSVSHLTATEVDNIFIDLDASPLVTGAGTIDLKGNNAAPTAASLSARNSLVTKGKTILHN